MLNYVARCSSMPRILSKCIYTIYICYIYLGNVHILINILVRSARRQQQQQRRQQHQQFATNFICAKVVNKRKTSDNILKYITCKQAEERERRGRERQTRYTGGMCNMLKRGSCAALRGICNYSYSNMGASFKQMLLWQSVSLTDRKRDSRTGRQTD